ncbi:MAG: cupin domain-containing protein [Bacteroidota bacterium]
MIRSKENTDSYTWGDNCLGWPLLETEGLSIKEELMPPNTQERPHFHKKAQQFFRILKGQAIFEMEDESVLVKQGEGILIPPNTVHCIRNDARENLEFIVISAPSTRGDRYEIENHK